MGASHDPILQRKRRLIQDLARDRDEDDPVVVVDVLLALADTRSRLGRWIRGDEVGPQEGASIASFLFVGDHARVFLGPIPSYPGLVVLVVDQAEFGILFRFISDASRT